MEGTHGVRSSGMNRLLQFDLLVNSSVKNICYKVCLFLIIIFCNGLHFSVPLCLRITIQQTGKFTALIFKLLLGKYAIMMACSVVLCTIYI